MSICITIIGSRKFTKYFDHNFLKQLRSRKITEYFGCNFSKQLKLWSIQTVIWQYLQYLRSCKFTDNLFRFNQVIINHLLYLNTNSVKKYVYIHRKKTANSCQINNFYIYVLIPSLLLFPYHLCYLHS